MLAELAAMEAGWLPLKEAVSLLELYARLGERKLEPAAVRWLGLLIAEQRPTLSNVQLAVGALVSLRDRPEQAVPVLQELVRVLPDRASAALARYVAQHVLPPNVPSYRQLAQAAARGTSRHVGS